MTKKSDKSNLPSKPKVRPGNAPPPKQVHLRPPNPPLRRNLPFDPGETR